MCQVLQNIFTNKVPLGVPKTMAQESDLWGFNSLGKGDCSYSIIDFLFANMISMRNPKYDSETRRLEGIKLTAEVRCYKPRPTAI